MFFLSWEISCMDDGTSMCSPSLCPTSTKSLRPKSTFPITIQAVTIGRLIKDPDQKKCCLDKLQSILMSHRQSKAGASGTLKLPRDYVYTVVIKGRRLVFLNITHSSFQTDKSSPPFSSLLSTSHIEFYIEPYNALYNRIGGAEMGVLRLSASL